MCRRAAVLLLLTSTLVVGCGSEPLFGRGAPYPAIDPQEFAATDAATGQRIVDRDDLPDTAMATLTLVAAGGPFPNADDGSAYVDDGGDLPPQPAGYYRVYTVVKPGEVGPSPWHLVVGSGGETFWTTDDFATFQQVRE